MTLRQESIGVDLFTEDMKGNQGFAKHWIHQASSE